MADRFVDVDTNLDDVFRVPGADTIEVQYGATLTVDSMPQLTAYGAIYRITVFRGTVLFDGRQVRETAFSSGSGALPTVGTTVTWGAGGTAGSGKVIEQTSGTGTSGVLTITKQSGENPNGTITDGTWAATVDTDKVGYLKVYIREAQYINAADGEAKHRVYGEWYEVGVGDGTDNQVFTLPHAGIQPAIWVETGNGTDEFEIWHNVNNTNDSAVYYDQLTDWGATFESGKVFEQRALSSTLTFGTAAGGGAPPSGARIRIPNVHFGTTSAVDETVESLSSYSSNTGCARAFFSGQMASIIVDKANLSTCWTSFNDSVDGVFTNLLTAIHAATSSFFNRISSSITFNECAFVSGRGVSTGDWANYAFQPTDCGGDVVFNDCVFVSLGNNAAFALTTSDGITFNGTNKFATARQNENSSNAVYLATSSNITFNGEVIVLNNQFEMTNVSNVYVASLAIGQLVAHGPTENNQVAINFSAQTSNVTIDSIRALDDGGAGKTEFHRSHLVALADCNNITIRNAGSITNKLSSPSVGALANITGFCKNIYLRRLWFDATGPFKLIEGMTSASDVNVDNCSWNYNSEIEPDSTRSLYRGVHGGSAGPGQTGGIEDDYGAVLASIFFDIFTSDTTGAVVLVFTPPGQKFAANVTVTGGDPSFNGIGDLYLRAVGDQVVWTWPHAILGHTGFQNVAHTVTGTNTGNMTYEYALDTGSGYGAWKTVSGANLSAESISPTGFRIKFRFTCTTANENNLVRGFWVQTTTTLAAQAANLYPLSTTRLTLTGVVPGSDVVILPAGGESPLLSVDATPVSTVTFDYETVQNVDICVYKAGYTPFAIRNYPLSTSAASLPIAQVADRNYVD